LWSRYIREILDDAKLGDQRLIFCAWSLGTSVLRNYLLSSGQKRIAGLILIAPVVGTKHCLEHLQDQDNADALAAFQVVSRIFDLHCSVSTRQEAFERFFQRLTARPLAPDEGYDRDVLLFLEKLS
jgi:pimeloyl-ACP methyl ester carboxylesterase